jgi:hypothetical protein
MSNLYSIRLLLLVPALIVLGGFMQATAYAEQAAGWKEVMQRDGVDVSSRSARGSAIDEFMGSTLIHAPVEAVEKVIDDVPSSTGWLPDCREAKVIRTIDGDSRLILFITKAQWPLSDRETLLLSEKHKNSADGKVVINFHAATDPSVPVGKGNVRVQAVEGRWILTPEGRAHTLIGYSLKSGPDGSVPAYFVNIASRDHVFGTLVGLRSFIMKQWSR